MHGTVKSVAPLMIVVCGAATVGLHVEDNTCLNQVARLAAFLGGDIEIHLFDADGAKWRGRGECYPAEPRAGQR